jgi:hypothetical protein
MAEPRTIAEVRADARVNDPHYAEVLDRDFPEAVYEPWVAFAAEQAPKWKAGMFPLLGDARPLFRLERRRVTEAGPSLTLTLVDESQTALVAAAREVDGA